MAGIINKQRNRHDDSTESESNRPKARRERLKDAMAAHQKREAAKTLVAVLTGDGKVAPDGPPKGVRLRGYQPRSSTTAHGRRAILLGIPFLGVGVFICFMAAGVVPMNAGDLKAPELVVAMFGAIFGVPGLIMLIHGLIGLRREAIARIGREHNAAEPWRHDNRWSEKGIRDHQSRSVFMALYGLLFMVLFASPFNLIAFDSGNGWAIAFVSVCVNLFVGCFAIAFFYQLARWMKFGSGFLSFRKFPYFTGERLNVDYIPTRGLRGADKITFTLRCVREAYEIHKVGQNNREVVVPYEVYNEVKQIDAATLQGAFDRSISLSFDLPENGESTSLSVRPPVYWELEAAAELPGVDLKSRFLLPVYRRS